MAEFDNASLLEDIRERGSLPASDLRFPDALLLKAATRELREAVAPLMQQAKSEHLVYEYTTPLVSGQASYRIPTRALGGGGLRDVAVVLADGTPRSLVELSADDLARQGNPANTGTPYGYYLRNASVVLVPSPNVSGSLSLPYYARPNALSAPADCAAIVGMASGPAPDSGGVLFVTVLDPPAAIADAARLDIVRGCPGFETLVLGGPNYNPDNLGGGLWQLEFSSARSAGYMATPAEGDYLCLPGTSAVPQVPPELQGLLAVRTVRRTLKAVGDARWKDFDSEAQELEGRAIQWLSPRNDGEPRSAPSPLATGLLGGLLGGVY